MNVHSRVTACSRARGFCSIIESPRRGLEFVTRKVTDGVAGSSWDSPITLRSAISSCAQGLCGDYVQRDVADAAQEKRMTS